MGIYVYDLPRYAILSLMARMLEMDNGRVFLPNGLYPLEKETFRLYHTSASIDIYIFDSFGQMQQVLFLFNNNSDEEE